MMNEENNREQGTESTYDRTAQSAPPQYGRNMDNPYYQDGQEKMTGLAAAYKSYWKNYTNFNDRTSRAGYWWVILVNYIINIVLFAALIGPAVALSTAGTLGIFDTAYSTAVLAAMFTGPGIILFIWSLVNIIPGLSLFVRRLHDTGRRWPNIFFLCIPVAGLIIVLILLVGGTKRAPENKLGDLPKQA
jgi:uncharacterized membrane protein YhaH (DUF805 family)